jgi:hypothetical protein
VIVLCGVVAIAAGITAAGGFGSTSEPGTTASTVAVAQVVCGPLGARVETPRVRARLDGVHVDVMNPSRVDLLQVRSSTDALLAEVPLDRDGVTENVFTIPPGAVTVTCVSGRLAGRDRSADVLEILPTARWISPDLACGEDVDRVEIRTRTTEDEPPSVTASRNVPGLRSTDVLLKPGYADTRWHGDLLVVRRGGETIARITRAQDRGGWSIIVTACPGTGLADA